MKIKQFLVTISVVLALFTLLTASAAFAAKQPLSHLGIDPDNFVTLTNGSGGNNGYPVPLWRVFPDGSTSDFPYTRVTGGTLIITDVQCAWNEHINYGALALEVNGQEVYRCIERRLDTSSDHLTAGIVVPDGGIILARYLEVNRLFLYGYIIPSSERAEEPPAGKIK